MEVIASLIREFPFGSFLIICSLIGAVVTVVRTIVNRDRPVCNCECCDDQDDDDCDDDEGEGPAIMGGSEED